jgi:ABC-type lipoprotein release transport system permease subunit
MTILNFKMLFRKGGTASSILAIALLVAILASTNSITNNINSQTKMLGRLVSTGETYLILDRNSTATTDSQIDTELTSLLNNLTTVKCTLPQRVLTATLTTSSENHTITLRGVEDVSNFLKLRRAYINGTAAKNETEANIGEILAMALSINRGDEVTLTLGNNLLKIMVASVIRTHAKRRRTNCSHGDC